MAALNPHLIDTATPPIPEAQGWLRTYSGACGPMVDLSQAVPGDAPPPAFLDQLGDAAASAEATRYGDILGDSALRQRYAADVSARYGAPIRPDEIAITAGCNQAFFVTMMAIAKAGDAVLLPAPWYFNHKMTLDMLGIEARPLSLSAEAGFVPDAAAAAALIDDRLRAIVLVTPNNPTGAVYPPPVVEAFFRLAAENDLWLIIDETYRDFLPEGSRRPHALFNTPGWADTLISLYSFSKSYAIPGHRIGAVTAAPNVLANIGKVLDCVQICAPRVPQIVLPWAMDALGEWQKETRAALARRTATFEAAVAEAPEWRIDQIGAYFAYVRHPFPGIPASRVAEVLARERGVLALPGSYFGPGQDDHLRVAFANVGETVLARLGARFARSDALRVDLATTSDRKNDHG